MLKYNYNLNLSSSSQEIVFDDLYLSSDLLVMSGTTANKKIYSTGDTLWVSSSYFPHELPVSITSLETVKRNGYLLIPTKTQIHKASSYYGDRDEMKDIYYVNFNGDVYFSSGDTKNFIIEGREYNEDSDASYIDIKKKVYIENDKVSIDGMTFNATISKESKLVLSDSIGQPYFYPSEWVDDDGMNTISSASTFVQKITFADNFSNTIPCKRASYGGHKAYINYNGSNLYIKYFYTNESIVSGAGVTVNNVNYPCQALDSMNYYNNYKNVNIYNVNDYVKDPNGNSTMAINGKRYVINFEPCDIEGDGINGSGIICLETVNENPSILINDVLSIKPINGDYITKVKYDSEGNCYVYFGGRKYSMIEHLCDVVNIADVEYTIEYEDDSTNPTVGTIAKTMLNDGSLMYFQVSSVVNGEIKVKKVERVGNDWVDTFSVIGNGENVSYVSVEYDVTKINGFLIDGKKCPIRHFEEEYDDGMYAVSYDYIETETSLTYKVQVINTIGSNKILCVPLLNGMFYDDMSLSELNDEILNSIYGGNFIIEKIENRFGVYDLICDNWVNMALEHGEPTSIYELANIRNNILITQKASYFSLPICLYKNVTNKIEYDYLIQNQYYSEESEKAINKLVDMEKDMYTPVYVKDGKKLNVNSMVFNLHFRTRDLGSWEIIDDTGFSDETISYEAYDINSLRVEQGAISADNGNNENGTNNYDIRVRTSGYFEAPIKIEASNNYKFFIFKYSGATYSNLVGPIDKIELQDTNYRYRLSLGTYNDDNVSEPSISVDENSAVISVNKVSNVENACTITVLENKIKNVPLTSNYQYCNYFITDYYPYNAYFNLESSNVIFGYKKGWGINKNGVEVENKDYKICDRSLYAPLRIETFGYKPSLRVFLYDLKDPSKFMFEYAYDNIYSYIELSDTRYSYKFMLRNDDSVYCNVTSRCSECFNEKAFSDVVDNSDLLGFMYFTTDDAKRKADKLSKSFLRLTFFDSKNPEKQNMLGTSTLYFDTSRYLDAIDRQYEKASNGKVSLHYEPTAKSRQLDRINGVSGFDNINANGKTSPSVLNEAFRTHIAYGGDTITTLGDLQLGVSEAKLDSRIIVKDSLSDKLSSEGFYAYILKEFSDKKQPKIIYMKAEFFHAGVGIKVPMVIPTKYDGNGGYDAIINKDESGNTEWNEETYNEFIEGYDTNSVFDRLYIPIKIEYDNSRKKFIYSIAEENNYSDTIQRVDNNLIFNLFELKIKAK